MVNFSSLSVLGCGWLGLPLASQLAAIGWAVNGSTTSAEKFRFLENSGIVPYLIHLPAAEDDQIKRFFNSEILIVNIPPKGNPEGFIEAISSVAELAAGAVKHIIFVSSTSVYADNNSVVTETGKPFPTTQSGQAMVKAEEILKSQKDFTTTIIRFAGLVGPGRHPGRFLAGKKEVANGLAPINLIHLDDCIGIISEILSRKAFGHTFNACSPNHPTRKDFYTKAAQSLGLDVPQFVDEKSSYKIIESNNVLAILKYDYKITDWLKWLT